MKFNIHYLFAGFALLFFANSCSKDATDYRNYLDDKEKVYPGVPATITAAPGNYRVRLSWNPSPDPSVQKYRVFWNNGADSIEVAPAAGGTSARVSVVIEDLVEYNYSFTVYAYDQKGNKSVPVQVNNVKVYGDSYQSSLSNRFLSTASPYVVEGNNITLNFETPDTINTGTTIKYTMLDGKEKSENLGPQESSITLTDYKGGTPIYYQSGYIPVVSAIDTFYTSVSNVLTDIQVPLNKALFREVKLANDVGTYTGETSLSQMWNGNTTPTDYPNIFHSNSMALPHYLTFDLGQTYTGLSQFEIIGRSSGNHNPTEFEIWGIDELTGAPLVLPYTGTGKNWTLLKRVVRSGDGIQPYKVLLDETPANIRYIRLRITKVASGSNSDSNISEVTFWRK